MQEIFNKGLDQIIDGLEGVVKSTDDFLISGRNMEEHDHRLRALLERLTVHKEVFVQTNRSGVPEPSHITNWN